jgi:hypothetical protein
MHIIYTNIIYYYTIAYYYLYKYYNYILLFIEILGTLPQIFSL